MTWTIAKDIGRRIRELRRSLGGPDGQPVTQEELGRRAGVRSSQVSQWERGTQQPSRSRLERWAEREGWPVTIFAEGHEGPSRLPFRESSVAGDVAEPGEPGERGDGRADALLAEFYRIMAQAAERGRALPPELARVVHELYRLGSRAPSDPPADVDDERPGDPGKGVPGW